MNRTDLVELAEASYRLDLDLRSWLRLISGIVRKDLDRGYGVVSWVMHFPEPERVEPVGPVEVFEGPPALGPRTRAMNTGLPKESVRAIWLCGQALRTGSELTRRLGGPPAEQTITQHRGDLPIVDGVGLTAIDGEGFAISFAGPASRPESTRPVDRARWARVAPHLAAGFRLRRRLLAQEGGEDGAEAIFSPEGRCLDARGAAMPRGARELLRDSVRTVERSRGALRRKDPDEAMKLWQGLVTGRWSLVDSFSSDQKRFIVARPNAPRVRDPRALTERERQTVSLAAAGESTKDIAYRLGLAPSTVGTHLMNGMRKLRVRRRSELARLHAVNASAAEVCNLELAGERLSALTLPVPEAGVLPAGLTGAERAVVQALIGGCSNAEIALQRRTSERTVANQVATLFRKLKVGSRAQLVARVTSEL